MTNVSSTVLLPLLVVVGAVVFVAVLFLAVARVRTRLRHSRSLPANITNSNPNLFIPRDDEDTPNNGA